MTVTCYIDNVQQWSQSVNFSGCKDKGESMLEGVILKGIGGFYYIDTERGVYECRARGIFRKEGIRPTVGDVVRISVLDEEKKKGSLGEILPEGMSSSVQGCPMWIRR